MSGAVIAALAAVRFGLRGLAAAVAVIWLAGLAWLARRGGGTEQFAVFAWWAVAGGAVLIALGYAALIGALRRRTAGSGEAPGRTDTASALPYRAALDASAGHAGVGLAERGGAATPATGVPAAATDQTAPVAPPADPASPLSDGELDRYARHIVLRELGGAGQRKLRAARVLIVGAGGLGAPTLMYLAAAGVGRITIADHDTVGLSNLQRQVIFQTADIGRPKAIAAAEAMARLNPHIAVTPLTRRITAGDAELIGTHDLVLDGTDSFASRATVNAACVAARVPLIAGSIAQWEGQVTLYDPARGGPCLACLFPEPPAPGLALSCAEAGVVGALPGVVGSMMALETVKLLGVPPDAGAGVRAQMILFDGLWGETRRIAIAARPDCAVCGGRGL